ncbi:hypothetical protein VYH97_07205 [Streptococcus anginosus]|uniref:hypothetical protein n=1 Tax=Bacteria TaxID=2 RepID=UPI0001BC63AC|nr:MULTISPECIES: hypothetical protein [Bacteria]HEN2272784.1 hypothetical protein [Streptococcus agalactiae]EFS28126.1 hypothetical protein FGAG_00447 [Fusobacterium gonidiaformans ATCC 25563]MED5843290.1 hypothetical protein [Streptococcus anginosus]MED5870378.1 hypothetical protein [Streptococcus anginosus]MED5899869.1 hypothetical protein [Streptococcus anginosus]
MSSCLRKIEYYGICFCERGGEYEDSEKLVDLVTALDTNFIYDDSKTNKFWRLDTKERSNNIFKLIYKSGKYNHSPNYISRLNGQERLSDKDLDEGECEKTHIVIDTNTSSLIIESRRSGISAFSIVKYINSFIKDRNLDFNKIKVVKELKEDFLSNIQALDRIQSVELFVEKEIIGSDYLNLIEPTTETQDEVVITIKAQKRKTLIRSQIIDRFKKIGLQGEKTKRIRVRGRDSDNITVLLDSLNQGKVEQIYVDLNENGTVNSNSFFEKAIEVL